MKTRVTTLLATAVLVPLFAADARVPGCDFDDDGLDDLAIGAPGEDREELDEGIVHVLRAGKSGLSADGAEILDQAVGNLLTPGADDGYGSALACGRFDEDTYDDLAVGLPGREVKGHPGAGAVIVYFGSPDALVEPSREPVLWTAADFGIDPGEEHRFGAALASGDLDGDGFDDLAIGSPGADPEEARGAGMVFVLTTGGGAELAPAPAGAAVLHQALAGVAGLPEEGDGFGHSLATGDFDGDGWEDLAVGVPGEDEEPLEIDDAGMVHVFFGGGSGPYISRVGDTESIQQNWLGDGLQRGDLFGWSLTAADFDDDGLDDLVVGVPFEDLESGVLTTVVDAGAVEILYGTPCGLVCAQSRTATFHQDSEHHAGHGDPGGEDPFAVEDEAEVGDLFGYAIASADVCTGFNSSRRDLVVGAPFEDTDDFDEEGNRIPNGVPDAGTIHILCGQAGHGITTGLRWYDFVWDTWHNSLLDQLFAGVSEGHWLGFSVTSGRYYGSTAITGVVAGEPGYLFGADHGAATELTVSCFFNDCELGDRRPWHQDFADPPPPSWPLGEVLEEGDSVGVAVR